MASRDLVTLTYHKPGTQPPIYVAGSFSDPSWQPIEMDYDAKNGEYFFTKGVEVGRGIDVHYKFRIGHGDWWALDPETETVTDSQGNVNHVIRLPADDAGPDNCDESCPMFSYETFEASDMDKAHASHPPQHNHHASHPQQDNEVELDYDYPEEHFSSNRDSIMAAVRRLSASIEQNQPNEEHDQGVAGEQSGAAGSRVSLQSIAEDEEADLDEGIAMSISPKKAQKARDEPIKSLTTPTDAASSTDGAYEVPSPSTDASEMNLRKRTKDNRPITPASNHSLHEAHKDGHWLQTFIRTIFVDWIGGFVMWLCGSNNRA
ncbi:Uu.00g059300.m01.CDS01 [Anthostomella pinea]|uniref:Uu.00g059300.m01.CDS01 n=1 Tax=Anthostomella pinea TaxID=933095 RepID=A0AAI8VLG4_9PEZI|nr:Uu.00g059300.m01.CDS01 [Anthostomella pinea]